MSIMQRDGRVNLLRGELHIIMLSVKLVCKFGKHLSAGNLLLR